MVHKRDGIWLRSILLSLLPVLILAQGAQENRRLTITGHAGEIPVVEMGGRSYIEIEALTRVVNGSLRSSGTQIVLTLPPAANSPSPNPSASQPQPAASGFSKDFLREAIEQMTVIREWRTALLNAIRQGYPVTEDWIATFRSQAQQNLRLASVAAVTEADRNAVRLLANEFNNMKRLADRFVEANRTRTYVPPDALANDPLDQKILNCAHALATMAANNQFVEDGSCQ
jgi:hypothetical protein